MVRKKRRKHSKRKGLTADRIRELGYLYVGKYMTNELNYKETKKKIESLVKRARSTHGKRVAQGYFMLLERAKQIKKSS